jgi:hypothetical protein
MDPETQKASSGTYGSTHGEAGSVDRERNIPRGSNITEQTVDPNYPERNRRFFAWEHLKPELQAISRPFAEAADQIMALPVCDQRNEAFRFLLLAKEAAVRTKVFA